MVEDSPPHPEGQFSKEEEKLLFEKQILSQVYASGRIHFVPECQDRIA